MGRAGCLPSALGREDFGASDNWAVPRWLHTHGVPGSSPRHSVVLSASLLCSNFSAFFSSISAPVRAPPSLCIWWDVEAFAGQGLAVAVAHWELFHLSWGGNSVRQTYLPFSLKQIQGQFVENVVWPVWKGAGRLQAVFRKQAAARVTFATAVTHRGWGW